MDINKKSYIYWSCRRSMIELEKCILLFFEKKYDKLNNQDKKIFISLLKVDDLNLYRWLFNQIEPLDIKFKYMIKLIQLCSKEHQILII
ncbi:MAG: hypothetical protein FT671_03320 [Pantoea sp. Brub]|nr:hypothetical protein [Pantoea sp. Brub]